jgi:hypothetical protein
VSGSTKLHGCVCVQFYRAATVTSTKLHGCACVQFYRDCDRYEHEVTRLCVRTVLQGLRPLRAQSYTAVCASSSTGTATVMQNTETGTSSS